MRFDWTITRGAFVLAVKLGDAALRLTGRIDARLRALGFVWRTIDTPGSTLFAERELQRIRTQIGTDRLAEEFRHMASVGATDDAERALRHSVGLVRPFDKRLLILKPPGATPEDKGVMVVKYTNYFKHVLRLLNVQQLLSAYHLVLEPSWVGFFLPEILAFQTFAPNRVFVQTWETRDWRFLEELESNLTPVALSPNAWTSAGVFHPVPGAEKVYDVVMVALWSDFKRHFALFRALRKAANPHIRVACVGQPWPRTLDSIRNEAARYGVERQIDFYESIGQPELNSIYNASRVMLLLSRKEGQSKAVVESMFAGTPAFLREGFNYGTRYHYLNQSTGGFIDERSLPEFLNRVHAGAYDDLRPHEWVAHHWNPTLATQTLERAIFGASTGRLCVKVNTPDLDYLEPDNWARLEPAYQQLRQFLR